MACKVGAVGLLRMAPLAGLQIPPRIRRMSRSPAWVQDAGRHEYRGVGFDAHAAPVHRDLLEVAVRAEFRLVAAEAALGVIRRLHGMYGDEVRPVRPGHRLPSPRQAPPCVGIDVPAIVAVEAVGLFMAIRAIVAGLLRQHAVLPGEKGPVVVYHAGSDMALEAVLPKLAVPVIPVIRPGEREADYGDQKDRGQEHYFECHVF